MGVANARIEDEDADENEDEVRRLLAIGYCEADAATDQLKGDARDRCVARVFGSVGV
jgi:hypothetical protein